MLINIEVVFATKDNQHSISLQVDSACSIPHAIQLSKLQSFFPDYDLSSLPVGVFGKRVFNIDQYQLQDGDRIEIYRPLTQTPNQKRLDRAKSR